MNCPHCGRPAAVARAACLYCGAPLTAAGARGAKPAPLPEPAAPRALVVVGLEAAEAATLASALGLSRYEAAQWARRGGYHLHRAAPPAEAEEERRRLAAHGLAVFVVDEAEARRAAEPEVALGGGRRGEALEMRTASGAVSVEAGELLLVVKGPIAREHPVNAERLRFAPIATLEPGFRFHLHRRAQPRPLEIDPSAFDFGAHRAGESSLLEVAGWVARLAEGAPVDDAFRRIPPALAPASPPGAGLAAAQEALRAGAGRADAVLDNLAQFRFYSAWRGAVERRARR